MMNAELISTFDDIRGELFLSKKLSCLEMSFSG